MRVTFGGLARVAATAALVAVLAGCGTSGPGPGFTGAASGSCDSLRKEMNALLARGVAGQVEAKQAGRKLSAQAEAQVERYNAALEGYLGQQCHLS